MSDEPDSEDWRTSRVQACIDDLERWARAFRLDGEHTVADLLEHTALALVVRPKKEGT